MITKDDILGALPKLAVADLVAIHAVITSLLNGATAAQTGHGTTLAGTLIEALSGALQTPLSPQNMPTKALAQINAKGPPLAKALTRDFPGWDSKKTTQLAFLRMLIGLLVDDLQGRGVNPTLGIITLNLHRIPEVFDSSFPLYRQSGLGVMVLKRFQ